MNNEGGGSEADAKYIHSHLTLSPEVHVECEVHELLTDLRHGEDVQRHAHGHRLAPVVRAHAAIIANLMSRMCHERVSNVSPMCHERVTCHVDITSKLFSSALMSTGCSWLMFLKDAELQRSGRFTERKFNKFEYFIYNWCNISIKKS